MSGGLFGSTLGGSAGQTIQHSVLILADLNSEKAIQNRIALKLLTFAWEQLLRLETDDFNMKMLMIVVVCCCFFSRTPNGKFRVNKYTETQYARINIGKIPMENFNIAFVIPSSIA